MTTAPWMLLLIALVMISAPGILAQEPARVINTEPGSRNLAEVFKQADTVAIVKVVSGDAENYDLAVYKAKVVKSFKGAAAGSTFYYGPYIGDRLGWDYLVFLRNVAKPASPKKTSRGGFGTIQYARVLDDGYGSMMISYVCAFDGTDPTQKCDYGVRVCTNYIALPKSMPTFPPAGEDAALGCRWVRKSALISLLDRLASAKK
jgi:hypothetical protein